MTALGGQVVKRTFSTFGGNSTGLSRPKTHEREGQDICDFEHVLRRMCWHRTQGHTRDCGLSSA
jgi:hypothetical protein